MAKKRAAVAVVKKPVSGMPIIPRLAVRREYCPFDEQEDTESIEVAVSAAVVLWDRTAGDVTIDDRAFFGPAARFIGGANAPDQGDARIAIAAYHHLTNCWRELLAKPCWSNVKTYPPANVLTALIDESLHGPECEAVFALRQHDHKAAIELLERRRLEAVAIVRPTMAMFLASLTVAGLRRPPKLRDDSPDEDEIAMARQIGKANPGITRDALAAQMEIGGTKASALMDIMRKERIIKGRKRKPRTARTCGTKQR